MRDAKSVQVLGCREVSLWVVLLTAACAVTPALANFCWNAFTSAESFW
jgi:hypothetical protein